MKTETPHRRKLFGLLIFAVTCLVFARLTTCEFTWWDDQETIHQNPRLNPPTWETLHFYWTFADERHTMGLYVPVTYTVWSGLALIAKLKQPDAQGIALNAAVFHTANVLLHAINAALVFQLLWRLFGNIVAAVLGAFIFSLHPVQVETVGWVSGTKDLLYATLSLGSLLLYARSTQILQEDPLARWARRWRYWVGLSLFVLAMLSKPTAVVVPLMSGVISIFLLRRSVRQTVIGLLPWLILMIPCVIWTQKVQPPTGLSSMPIWVRPFVAADAITFYFYKLVWPAHLCLDYGRNPDAIIKSHAIYFTWVAPATVGVLLFWKYKLARPLIAASLLFLMPLLPLLGFVPFEFQAISTTADHYLYLPMFGVAVAVAWIFNRPISQSTLSAAIVLLGLLAARSVMQEPVWQDTRSLLYHTLVINPRSTAALGGLGFITGRDARQLFDQGKRAEARPLFDQSIEWYKKALDISPNSAPSMANLALDYQKIDRQDLGLELLHRITTIEPTLPADLQADPMTVAHLLLNFGDIHGAIAWLDDVLARNPGNIEAELLREQAAAHLQTSTHKDAAR